MHLLFDRCKALASSQRISRGHYWIGLSAGGDLHGTHMYPVYLQCVQG